MMLLYLVKKDFLLIKKHVPLIVSLAFGIPLFFMWKAPDLMGFTAFMISVMYTEYMLVQSISLAETKYPKADALLCAVPYSRSAVVKARYVFFLFVFVLCYVAYGILSLIIPQISVLSGFDLLITLLIILTFLGIYTPLQYKLGYEKMKYVLMIITIAMPFVLPQIVTALVESNIDFQVLGNLPVFAQYLVLAVFILVVTLLSLAASIKIYSKKEL